MAVLVPSALAILVVAAILHLGGRHRNGVTARIHVDDLAVGAGPGICVITGVPTSHRTEASSSESGSQAWWFVLVLFGPIGWVALFVLLAMARRPGRVSGILPIAPEAIGHYDAAVRVSRQAMLGAFAIVAGGIALHTWGGFELRTPLLVALGGGALACVLVGFGAAIITPFRWVDLELDGSGRWVTISRAHPAYAAELHRHNAATHARQA